jgi:hypothetical protein
MRRILRLAEFDGLGLLTLVGCVLIVATIVSSVSIGVYLDNRRCEFESGDRGFQQSRWTIGSGCLVEVGDHWEPLRWQRVLKRRAGL